MQVFSLNQDWNFKKEEETDFQTVSIPHTVKIEPLNVSQNEQGTYIYEKQFIVPICYPEQRVLLKFEAVMMNCKIYLNGNQIAKHYGGYLPFLMDITAFVAQQNANTLTVYVDNRDDPETPPGKPTKDLDFLYYGGIYRDVTLEIVPPIYLTDATDPAVQRGGISIQTEQNEKVARVFVQESIKSYSLEDVYATVRFSLYFHDKLITEQAKTVLVKAAEAASVEGMLEVLSPNLWDIDSPYLYTLKTTLNAGIYTDTRESTFGIREISIEEDGLHLNGRKIRLFGLNRGQQYPYIGISASNEAQRREARMLKETGVNCLRLSHYPQSPAFIDECDHLGLLLLDPIPGWQFLGNQIWKRRLQENLIELVRRDRNHPSVVIFEVTPNETNWATKKGDLFLHHLHELVKEEAPKALTGGDSVGRKNALRAGFDVPYYGKDSRLPICRAMHPDRRLPLKREYGDWGFGGNKSTSRVSRADGEKAMQLQTWNFQYAHNDNHREQLLGDLIWEAIDHNRGYYPDAPISKSGIFDIFRIPKLSYQFVRSQKPAKSREEYVVFLQALSWENKTKLIFYSNAERLDLYADTVKIASQYSDSGEDRPFDQKKSKQINDNYWMTKEDHIATSEKPCLLAKHVISCMFDGGNCQHMDFPPFTFQNLSLQGVKELTVKAFVHEEEVKSVSFYPNQKAVSLSLEAKTYGLALKANDNDFIFVHVKALDKNQNIDTSYTEEIELEIENGHTIGHSRIQAEVGIAGFMVRANTNVSEIVLRASNLQKTMVTECVLQTE